MCLVQDLSASLFPGPEFRLTLDGTRKQRQLPYCELKANRRQCLEHFVCFYVCRGHKTRQKLLLHSDLQLELSQSLQNSSGKKIPKEIK